MSEPKTFVQVRKVHRSWQAILRTRSFSIEMTKSAHYGPVHHFATMVADELSLPLIIPSDK